VTDSSRTRTIGRYRQLACYTHFEKVVNKMQMVVFVLIFAPVLIAGGVKLYFDMREER